MLIAAFAINRAHDDMLDGIGAADLAVVGAGYSGLWTALMAKERDPGRDVVVIEERLVRARRRAYA